MEKIIFSREAAAKYLGIDKRFLDRWTETCPDLPFYRLGHLTRYRKEDLDKWLESKRVNNEHGVDQDDEK